METKRKILIIENQIIQFKDIIKLLDKFGYQSFPDEETFKEYIDWIRIYLNPRYTSDRRNRFWQKILEKTKEFNPEVLIIDHILVGTHNAQDGIDLAIKFRENGIAQPIIFFSRTDVNSIDICNRLPDVLGKKEWIFKGYARADILEPEFFEKEVIPIIENFMNNQWKNMKNQPEDYEIAKIEPWANLREANYLYEVTRFGDIELKATLRRLEKYGICLIRLFGQDAHSETTLRSIFDIIGDAATQQNDFIGDVKDLLPKSGVEANTGSSAGDLGFHIDGTQEVDQPAMLMFQYITTADLGGFSRFLDMAKVVDDLGEEIKNELLINLSRSDAATFEKKEMKLESPIFHFPNNRSLACRLRFDAVMTPNEVCKIYLDILSKKLNDRKYEIKFLPRPGDIIIFDNWRVMHARSEIYGTTQRHHRRVWLEALRPEHQPEYKLGIRPLPDEIIVEMKRNNKPRTKKS